MPIFRREKKSGPLTVADAEIVRLELNQTQQMLGVGTDSGMTLSWFRGYENLPEQPALPAFIKIGELVDQCLEIPHVSERIPQHILNMTPENKEQLLRAMDALKYAVIADCGAVRSVFLNWQQLTMFRLSRRMPNESELFFTLMGWCLAYLRSHFFDTSGSILSGLGQHSQAEEAFRLMVTFDRVMEENLIDGRKCFDLLSAERRADLIRDCLTPTVQRLIE